MVWNLGAVKNSGFDSDAENIFTVEVAINPEHGPLGVKRVIHVG